MVDDARNTLEAADNKASAEACERARTARERREVEQRRRLDELRAHAAAAQAQRERRDQERRKRQDEQRERDTDRRHQVEERKRAIWEASVSRREALLQRERDREERLERARQARSTPRSAFAFGSSTPRLLEPVDSAGFFWAARRASSTSNVMFASAPLTRRGSALHLDISDNDNKDDIDRSPQPIAWNSVARRRTDLVPTLPASRGPGRAYSMTRLDKLPSRTNLTSASPSMHHLNRQGRSGDTTPGSRPGSAMSTSVQSTSVPRRPHSARRPRPASIAGTGVNTPRGGHEGGLSVVTTPSVSRDASSTNMAASVSSVTRRHPPSTPRRPRPVSVHVTPQTPVQPHKPAVTPGDGKPPILHRKPKLSKDHDKSPRMAGVKARSVSPGHTSMSPSPAASKESSVDKDVTPKKTSNVKDKSQVSATEVTQKLEALQVEDPLTDNLHEQINEKDDKTQAKATETRTEEQRPVEISKPPVEVSKPTDKPAETVQTDVLLPVEVQKEDKLEEKVEDKLEEKVEDKKEEKAVDKIEEKITEKREIRPELPEKKEPSPDKPEESDMTASMTARRITTEEQAKAALAERRRRAREELEKQAELERQRLQREAEEEAERQRLEEERQRREEEEAKELAALQRSMEQEKLRKAIEAQQQLEREEAERKAKEEAEKQLRLKEEEEKKKALEEADKLKKEEAEREEKERIARKQRVEAIMARTRMRKAEEEKKQESKQPATNGGQVTDTTPSQVGAGDNGNPPDVTNGNECAVKTEDMLGLTNSDVPAEHPTKPGATDTPTNNGNVEAVHTTHVGHLSSTFIQNERNMAEDTKEPKMDGAGDFTSHNGHGNNHSHPLTLQNAI